MLPWILRAIVVGALLGAVAGAEPWRSAGELEADLGGGTDASRSLVSVLSILRQSWSSHDHPSHRMH